MCKMFKFFSTSNKNICFLFFLFLASFLFRFFIAFYFKHISAYPDELFFYHTAENLATQRGLMVYNYPTSFQKILYSFFLIPAFLFENRETQQILFNFINSFVVCSAIFPAYFIARFLLKNNYSILIITFLSVLLPDLSFNLTFLSENIFLPLSLWLFYLFLKLFENNHQFHPFYSLFLGFICFIAYSCKEIALFFPLAFLSSIFIFHFFKLNQNNLFYSLKNISLVFFTFLVFYFSLQNIFFSNINNFYSTQIAFAGIIPPEHFYSFMLFCFFNFILSILVVVFFFPFVLPFVFWRELNLIHKKCFIFIVILILGTALTLAYTIYVREMDFNLPAPRSLLRYVTYIWIPLLCILFAFLEYQLPQKKIKLMVYSFIPALLFFFIYKGSYSIVRVDNMMLSFLDARNTALYILNFKILFLILIFFICLFFHFFKTKIIYFIAFLLSLSFVYQNTINIIDLKNQNFVSKNYFLEMNKIENLIKRNPNKAFLVLNNQWWFNLEQGLADSFLNYPNVYTANLDYFLFFDNINPKEIPVLWFVPNDSGKFYSFKKIDYIILPKNIKLKQINNNLNFNKNDYSIVIENSILLKNENQFLFNIYQLKNPHDFPKIHLEFLN